VRRCRVQPKLVLVRMVTMSRTSLRSLGYRNSHKYSMSLAEDTELPGGTARILSDTYLSLSSVNVTRTSSSDMKVNEVNSGSSINCPKTEVSCSYHYLISTSPVPDNKNCHCIPRSVAKKDAQVWPTDAYRNRD